MAKTPRGEGTHPRRCIAVNECIARWMFKSQNTKCVINPALSQQARAKDAVRRADVAKRVLIVGAGPSGCEAAIGAQLHLVRRRLPPHRDDEHDQRLQGRVRGLSPSMSVSAHKSHNAILTATRPSYWPQARSAQVTRRRHRRRRVARNGNHARRRLGHRAWRHRNRYVSRSAGLRSRAAASGSARRPATAESTLMIFSAIVSRRPPRLTLQ